MCKRIIAECLGWVSNFAVDVLNERICFFIFHQPPFPEKAKKIDRSEGKIEDGKNS